jgi:DNA-binding GntR family transcriptional regulator
MSDAPVKGLVSAEEGSDLVNKITHHLLQNPFDLLDTQRLMAQFHASASIVRQALQQFETMEVTTQKRSTMQLKEMENPTRNLIFSLLRRPHDLVDARQLMRRYGVSSKQAQQALDWIAQRIVDGDEVEVVENLTCS